jgi:hypothetical protein
MPPHAERSKPRQPGCAVWGYPATYGCTTWTTPGRCMPAPCVPNPLQTGLDLSECLQFVLGQY